MKGIDVSAHQGNIDLSANDYVVIGTVESFVKLREYYGEKVVLPIYIEVDDGVRLSRALDRERQQSQPKYEEMCRRFLADQQDFSKDKLEKAKITNLFDNNENSKNTCNKIAEFIKKRRD